MNAVRVAVVGLGGVAQSVHLPVLQRRRSEVDLVAVVEPSPSRLDDIAARYGVPPSGRFSTLSDLLEAVDDGLRVDAAILASPGDHAGDAGRLIVAGIRVLAEKPLSYSRAELNALEATLDECGRPAGDWLRIGYMKEHDRAVAELVTALSGRRVRALHIEVLHPADARQLAFARLLPPAEDVTVDLVPAIDRAARSVRSAIGEPEPHLRRLYEQVLLGSIVHDIALVRHLGLGLETVIDARRTGDGFPGSVTASGTTADGVPWTLSWHFIDTYPEYSEKVIVHHDEGTFELAFTTPYVLNYPTVLTVRAAGADLGSSRRDLSWPQEEAFDRELSVLLSLVTDTPLPGSSLDEARQDLTTAQRLWAACARSAGATPDPVSEAARASSRAARSSERTDDE